MGYHYIPQQYLRGFADESDLLWAFTLGNRKGAPTGTNQVAYWSKTRGWPKEVETYITEKFEHPGNEVLRRLSGMQDIDLRERQTLAQYILNLRKRTPEGKSGVLSLIPQTAQELKTRIRHELGMLYGLGGLSHAEVRAIAGPVAEILAGYETAPPASIWHEQVRQPSTLQLVAFISSMEWVVLHNSAGQFVTGDHPFYWDPVKGLGDSELTVPLTANLALLCLPSKTGDFRYANGVDESIALEVNRRTCLLSKRLFRRSEHLDKYPLPERNTELWRPLRQLFSSEANA